MSSSTYALEMDELYYECVDASIVNTFFVEATGSVEKKNTTKNPKKQLEVTPSQSVIGKVTGSVKETIGKLMKTLSTFIDKLLSKMRGAFSMARLKALRLYNTVKVRIKIKDKDVVDFTEKLMKLSEWDAQECWKDYDALVHNRITRDDFRRKITNRYDEVMRQLLELSKTNRKSQLVIWGNQADIPSKTVADAADIIYKMQRTCADAGNKAFAMAYKYSDRLMSESERRATEKKDAQEAVAFAQHMTQVNRKIASQISAYHDKIIQDANRLEARARREAGMVEGAVNTKK